MLDPNFIPVNYLQTGGLLSFIGYILILIMSVRVSLTICNSKNRYSVEYVVVSCSIIIMLTFLFQRTTMWESPLFALLFAPVLVDVIKKTAS